MFAKGPMPGETPKEEALKLLPAGTECKKVTRMGITGFVVILPDGKNVASSGNASQAWERARDWACRNRQENDGSIPLS